MVEQQQRAIQFDPFHLRIGDRGGEDRPTIGLFANVANETLNHLPVNPLTFDLRQIGSIAFAILADKAHVVSNILTTLKKAQVLCLTIDTVNPLVGRAEALDGLFPGNRSEYFWPGVQATEGWRA